MRRLAVLACVACVACGGADHSSDSEYDGPPLPWPYAAFPQLAQPSPSEQRRAELGRLLFYDPVLSGDRATACATCHSEIWGMSDGLAVSVGVDGQGPTGPGRSGPNRTRRNAQTLWNVAFRRELFWDGRAADLEAQALEPLRADNELGRPPEEAAQELGGIAAYRQLFAEAFAGEDVVQPSQLARALAAFQRTLVSRRAPYDQYVAGDVGALGEQTRRGMELFAEAGCADCHRPPLFSGPGVARRLDEQAQDLGRFEVTGDPVDRAAFRIPTLRNARDSEPYFHDGSALTLNDAVAAEVLRQQQQGRARELSAEEVELIVRFIDKALTDRSGEPDRPKQVPSGLPVPKDGFRIPR